MQHEIDLAHGAGPSAEKLGLLGGIAEDIPYLEVGIELTVDPKDGFDVEQRPGDLVLQQRLGRGERHEESSNIIELQPNVVPTLDV